jgi:MoxR-like ATPase
VIFGQESVVEQTLLAVLSGGHALLVGVPGLAKTKLVTTLGAVLGLSSNRIQFTPDLMPSDILGSEVMDQDENKPAILPFPARPGVHPAADGR